ncbi:unnamed protein product [Leptidea sinapis]|uniref:Uncharacterized protein n=1 Tax=Leptidea sinapis TaxID=189913 RepID=A0A5E4QUW7_9NEOP|nr:unnamed protein product [Leptidea sinapis]
MNTTVHCFTTACEVIWSAIIFGLLVVCLAILAQVPKVQPLTQLQPHYLQPQLQLLQLQPPHQLRPLQLPRQQLQPQQL